MPLTEYLLPEFDTEMKKTRTTLDRLPQEKAEYKPHNKSMPLAKLANHTSDIAGFVSMILTQDQLDVTKRDPNAPPSPSTNAERLERFDAMAVASREELHRATDTHLNEHWKLVAGDHVIFHGTRYHAIRTFFFNHMIHHRAQLGVYLRLNDCPVPSIYGPSADESSA